MQELERSQILDGTFTYPSKLIKLYPTKHFYGRLEERGIGINCIPTVVRITKENIHSGRTKDGKKLSSVVVRLKYNGSKYLFLCFSPRDGALKTLWFRKRRTYESRRRRERTDVEDT